MTKLWLSGFFYKEGRRVLEKGIALARMSCHDALQGPSTLARTLLLYLQRYKDGRGRKLKWFSLGRRFSTDFTPRVAASPGHCQELSALTLNVCLCACQTTNQET